MLTGAIVSDKYTVDRSYSGVTNTLLTGTIVERQINC